MITLGLDPGSASLGIAALDTAPPIPLVIGAATIPVDPKNLARAVSAVCAAIATSNPDTIAIEWSARPYAPKGATPQALAAIAHAREVMAVLVDRVGQRAATWRDCGGCGAPAGAACADGCEGAGRGIPVVKIPAATWRARVGVTRTRRAGVAGFRGAAWARLNPRRDTADKRVARALERALGESGAEALEDVHQRDAAGVALGVAMGAATPVTPLAKRTRGPSTGAPRVRPRKLGGRRQREGHPSDAAFDALMAARGPEPEVTSPVITLRLTDVPKLPYSGRR